jgi:hypothetical protein
MAVDAMRDGGHEQLTAYNEAQLAEACAHFDRLGRRCRPERLAGQKEVLIPSNFKPSERQAAIAIGTFGFPM